MTRLRSGANIAGATAWKSAFNHPAFVYFGAAHFVATPRANFLFAPETPIWLQTAVRMEGAKIIEALAARLSGNLDVQPDLFISFDGNGPDGLLRYSGDALPGQVQIAFAGGGWRERSAMGLALMRKAIAHEATHLWQAAIRPTSPDHAGLDP